jgi:hypothetical protein
MKSDGRPWCFKYFISLAGSGSLETLAGSYDFSSRRIDMDLKHQNGEFSRQTGGWPLPDPAVEHRSLAVLPIITAVAAAGLLAFLFVLPSFYAGPDFSGARSARPGAITQTTPPGTRP